MTLDREENTIPTNNNKPEMFTALLGPTLHLSFYPLFHFCFHAKGKEEEEEKTMAAQI